MTYSSIVITLFLTVVISNFVARTVLYATGYKLFGLRDYRHGALCVTAIAVGVAAARGGWGITTTISVMVGLAIGSIIIHKGEIEHERR